MIRSSLFGTGIRFALATTLLCGTTLGGIVLLTNDGGSETPSSFSVPHYDAAVVPGRTDGGRITSVNRGISVIPHPTISLSSGGHWSEAQPSPSVSSRTSPSAYGSVSGTGVPHTVIMPVVGASGAAGGGVGGAAVGSSTGSYNAVGSGAMAVASFSFASASMRPSFNSGHFAGGRLEGDPGITPPGVYDGNEPGVISGDENSTTDNSIITSYGQPVGDALWPLLLFALIYAFFRRPVSFRRITLKTKSTSTNNANILSQIKEQ